MFEKIRFAFGIAIGSYALILAPAVIPYLLLRGKKLQA